MKSPNRVDVELVPERAKRQALTAHCLRWDWSVGQSRGVPVLPGMRVLGQLQMLGWSVLVTCGWPNGRLEPRWSLTSLPFSPAVQ